MSVETCLILNWFNNSLGNLVRIVKPKNKYKVIQCYVLVHQGQYSYLSPANLCPLPPVETTIPLINQTSTFQTMEMNKSMAKYSTYMVSNVLK